MNSLRIALAQIDVRSLDVRANTETYARWTTEAKRQCCDLIVFPELSDIGYALDEIAAVARPWPEYEPFLKLCELARTLQIGIAAGICEKSTEGIFDSLVLINAGGTVAGRYRKIQLFAPMGETSCFNPGDQPIVADFRGHQTGLMICNDIRFPEIARSVALMGAEAAIVTSAWPFPRVGHWDTLVRARAIENQIFLIAVNRIGKAGGLTFSGRSMVVDPYGSTVVAGSEDRESLLVCEIDWDTLTDVRARHPGIATRRPGAYRLESRFVEKPGVQEHH